MPRKVADTPLAREIDRLVSLYGSDEKLAHKIGRGASRFLVMRWRADGTTPEKPDYVERLVELGVDRDLIESARVREIETRESLTSRVEALEGEVDDLKVALRAARLATDRVRGRLAKLEQAVAPLLEDQQEAGSTRRARSGR